MIKLISLLNEASGQTYFSTFRAAVDYARAEAEKKGYDIDQDDWDSEITFGKYYNKARPSIGKTHSFSIGLSKNGNSQRKALQIQVYGMDNGKYELNWYIR